MGAESTSGASGFSAASRGGGMTVEECEDMIQRSLRNPTVKFLKDHLEKAGCSIGGNFIKAVQCKEAAPVVIFPGKGLLQAGIVTEEGGKLNLSTLNAIGLYKTKSKSILLRSSCKGCHKKPFDRAP